MMSHENLVLPPSAYYNFYPSTMAKEALLHIMCIGDFHYAAGYDLSRTSFDSFLLEIILEGRVNIETEGEQLTAHAGQEDNAPSGTAFRQGEFRAEPGVFPA